MFCNECNQKLKQCATVRIATRAVGGNSLGFREKLPTQGGLESGASQRVALRPAA